MGIGWGLSTPLSAYGFHPDEWVVYATAQRLNPFAFQLDPNFYNYGTFYLFWVRLLTSPMESAAEGTTQAVATITSSFLFPRLLTAIAGASLAAVTWIAFRRRIGPWGALAAAVSLAIAPGLVVHSRFMTVDVFAVFLLWAGLVVALTTPGSREPLKQAALAGLLVGLSAGTKYSGVLGLVALPFFWWSLEPILRRKCLFAALVMVVVGFLAGTPGALLNTNAFLRDFKYELLHTSTGHGLVFAGTPSGFVMHLANLVEGYGTIMTLLGIAGLAWAARDRAAWAVGLLVFAVAYFLVIGRAEVKFLRYTFPLVPCLAAGFGYFVQRARENPHWSGKLAMTVAILGLSGFFGGGLSGMARRTLEMVAIDPRDLAGEFLIKAAPSSVGLVADPWFYSPSVYPLIQAPRFVPFSEREEWRQASPIPVLRYLPENPAERFDWDARLLTEIRPDRVVFSTFESEDLARLSRDKDLPSELRIQVDRYLNFLDKLQEGYSLEIAFGGGSMIHDMMYIRPKLWIWKRKPNSLNPSSDSSTTSSTSGEAPR